MLRVVQSRPRWVVFAPPGRKLFLVGSDGLDQLAVDDGHTVLGEHCEDVQSLFSLLCFDLVDLVALGHGLKMTQTMLTVYSNLLYSVDLRENPMFAGVKQGSNPLQVNEAQGHVALAVARSVEVANDLLSLSLRVGAVVLHSSCNHGRKLGRLAVLGLPVARGETELPAPGLKVLRWDEEILGREAVLTSETLHAVAA